MTQLLFANNAASTLAAPISTTATTVVLAAGTGSLFPSPGSGQAFTLTFTPAVGGAQTEIVYCTARLGDSLTISRGMEGTTAQAWTGGDNASQFITAGALQSFAQSSAAGNYAHDTGTANTLIAGLPVAPANLAALVGVPVLIQKGATANTGAVTLALNGLSSVPVTHADGTALGNGEWPASGIGLVVLNSAQSEYQLLTIMTAPATLAEFTSSNTSSGWEKLPSGLIEQWGTASTSSGSGNIVFPIAFPNGAFVGSAIIGLLGTEVEATALILIDPTSITTTGMNIYSEPGASTTCSYRIKGH